MEEQRANVVITRSPKSQGISFILTFLFGPLGLFYSTVSGGVIMLILGTIIAVVTLGMGVIVVWLACIIWGAVAVSSYNNRLLSGGNGGCGAGRMEAGDKEVTKDEPGQYRAEVQTEAAEQWQKALSLKSEEELRTIVNEANIYGPKMVRAVREELTARAVGKRRQRTEEEIRREEEEERKAEAERSRQEEEERAQREAVRAAEMARIAAANKRMARRAAVIAPVVLVLVALTGFLLWNNTAERLTERGRQAYPSNREKAIKLFERAAEKETSGDAAFELFGIDGSRYYLEKAADHGHLEANRIYGKQSVERGEYSRAIPYLSVADRNAETCYLLGCAYFATKQTDEAGRVLKEAVEKGSREANVRLGDWYLCYGKVVNFNEALKCYQNAPKNWPGVAEKIQVLQDLQNRALRSGWAQGFSGDSWDNGRSRFHGEREYYGDKSILRGIYYQNPEDHRYYGKFTTRKELKSGLGIVSYTDGTVYVGNLKVVSHSGNSYSVYYSGKGTITYSDGLPRTGQWKENQQIGPYTETDIFGRIISK